MREALKYVRFRLTRLGSTDAAVHNLAVALLSLEPDRCRAGQPVCGWYCILLHFFVPLG